MIENKNWKKRILSLVLCFVMVMTILPSAPIHAHATEAGTEGVVDVTEPLSDVMEESTAPSTEAATEPSTEATEPAPVCDCGTDDAAIHATTCAVYVAPENPVCYCTEKCTEVNEWCDVCGVDFTACTGTDTSAVYAEGDKVSVTINGETTYYTSIKDAVAKANESGNATITLLQDTTTGERLDITKSATLDLNGNTLSCTAYFADDYETMVAITTNNTKLTIIDSVGGGKLDGTGTDYALMLGEPGAYTARSASAYIDGSTVSGSVKTVSGTSMTVSGSTVESNSVVATIDMTNETTLNVFNSQILNTHSSSAASAIDNIGTLTITDSTISGSIGVVNGGTANISGNTNITGTVCSVKSRVGSQDSTLTITGGSYTGGINISGGTATISGGSYTGGIVVSGGTATISNGTITESSAENAVEVSGSAELTISGGTFSATAGGTWDTGVYVHDGGTVKITGGTITSTAYGMYNERGSATITGGSISGGTVDLYVGGSDSILNLTLDEGKTVGATFPGGITVEGTTLAELLATDTAAYWGVVDGKDTMLTVADDATSITDNGDITIRAICDHSGNTAPAVDNTNGTHSFTCTVCGGTVTEDHVSEKEENKATCKKLAVCDTCGASYGDLGDHTGGTATCTAQAVCEVCGESYGELDPDNHEYEKNNGICCETYQPAEPNESGYYEIGNAGQLFWFAQQVNVEGNREIKGVLTADIDLENRPWTPIGETGENNKNFRGVFDGQNHTIKGLYVEGTQNGVGFFGEVRTGTVKNFTIYGEVVVDTEVAYVGGVIGSACGLNSTDHGLERNGAVIQNITSYVNLTAKVHGVGKIGGFVGYANHESLIENCSWYGTFDAGIYRVDDGAGGFIGHIYTNSSVTIRNCAAYGTIKTDYAKNSFSSKPTIYMGGFLSLSDTGAKTVLENCLFAGKFERGENLTDEARLGAFGTLRSVNSIKNCYYLGDGVLEAVHSDSPLKPGENIEITSVTGEQLKSGEVAYLLQEANNIWGQTINAQNYPVLGGEKVYYGYTSCGDAEKKYTNDEKASAEKPGHSIGAVGDKPASCAASAYCSVCESYYGEVDTTNHDETVAYVNGFCPNCDAFEPATDSDSNGYYDIDNAGKLYWFAAQVNSGKTNINGELKANIVINEGVLAEMIRLNPDPSRFRPWTPIGTEDNAYTGDFCGLEHTISGLYFNDSNAGYVGLFGYVGSGMVNHLGVIDSYFNGSWAVGGVVGHNEGAVEYAYSNSYVGGTGCIGGVVGDNRGTVMYAYNLGSISGLSQVGGVVGANYNTVKNCYNIVSISGDSLFGDVVGDNCGTLENCYYPADAETDELDGTTAKTWAQFKSGEVAYLLGRPFGQNISTHSLPVLYGETVYAVHNCKNEVTYSNTNENLGHNYVNGVCTVCGASQTVVSVDISWGAMEFTYTDGEWQPESHTYAEGEWTPDADGGNVITVKNNGNVAVNVTIAYEETLTEVAGSFTDEGDNAITSPFALAVEEEKKIKLILTGKPSSTLDAQTLGSVTVTITLPEE